MLYSLFSHVFREYDIRGIAGCEISTGLAYRLGRIFPEQLDQRSLPIAVARDVRLSGYDLQQALMDGLLDSGMDVLDLGVMPTPLVYYSVFQQPLAGCIQVTASHNPGRDNGFKMMRGRQSLSSSEIQNIFLRLQQPDPPINVTGKISQHSVQQHYLDFVSGDCPLQRPLKVVLDAGNGPAGMVAVPLYRRMGCEVIELYCEPDGHFPNHHPDPTREENLQDLIASVHEHQADLGLAFDGDGDRIGMVDEQGNIIWADMMLLLLARHMLRSNPGASIIAEAKSSVRLYEEVRRAGGKALMSRTGHTNIKKKMQASGALLAGEMTGHIFFADRFFGYDDAIYAGARLMQVIAEQNEPASSLLHDVSATSCTPEIRIYCDDSKKFNIVAEAKTHFYALGYDVVDIDGVRIEFSDGWGLLRASNSEPKLSMRFEATNKKRMNEIRHLIEEWLSHQM